MCAERAKERGRANLLNASTGFTVSYDGGGRVPFSRVTPLVALLNGVECDVQNIEPINLVLHVS